MLRRILVAIGIIYLIIFAFSSLVEDAIGSRICYLIIGNASKIAALTVQNADPDLRNAAFFGNKERRTSGYDALVIGSGQDDGTWNIDTTKMGNLVIFKVVHGPASGSSHVLLGSRFRNNDDTDSYVGGQIRLEKQPNSNEVDIVFYAADGLNGYPNDPPQRFRIKGDTGSIETGDFKVTRDYLEFKGRKITAEDIDKLLALIK